MPNVPLETIHLPVAGDRRRPGGARGEVQPANIDLLPSGFVRNVRDPAAIGRKVSPVLVGRSVDHRKRLAVPCGVGSKRQSPDIAPECIDQELSVTRPIGERLRGVPLKLVQQFVIARPVGGFLIDPRKAPPVR
jgi:hypothetical protein